LKWFEYKLKEIRKEEEGRSFFIFWLKILFLGKMKLISVKINWRLNKIEKEGMKEERRHFFCID